MGLDIRIIRAKTNPSAAHEEAIDWDTADGDFYEKEDADGITAQFKSVYYARKFWDLYTMVEWKINYEACTFVEIDKETIEAMLHLASHTPDYFGGFNTVPQLCEMLHRFDAWEREGYHLYYEADY